jgi:hypothetical protein
VALLLKSPVSAYFSGIGKSTGVFVKTRSLALLLALALAAGSAVAEEDVGIGPWRLGMSKEQVLALAEPGPYKETASGGLETDGAKFKGQKAEASFTFASAGLGSIRVKVHEGGDWSKAVTAVLEVFDYFKASYGGANVKDIADNPDRKELDELLRQLLGTAEPLNDARKKSGSYMVTTYDMMPLKQPAESRLHCQWVYDGKANRYAVYLYQDLPKAPKREVEDNVEIKKL